MINIKMNLDFKIYDFLKLIGSHIKQNEKKYWFLNVLQK